MCIYYVSTVTHLYTGGLKSNIYVSHISKVSPEGNIKMLVDQQKSINDSTIPEIIILDIHIAISPVSSTTIHIIKIH